MGYVIDKRHVALSASKDIREICNSLFQNLGFNYFNYSRLFSDFSHTSLTSSPEWADFFYTHDYKNEFLYSETIVKLVGKFRFLMWSDFKSHPLIKNLNDTFHTDHGIILIEAGDNYTDFYSFAAPSSCQNISSFYLNNLHLLQNFIYYFREKAASLIETANKSRIYLPGIERPIVPQDEEKNFLKNSTGLSQTINTEKFMKTTKVKRYYTRDFSLYLTGREMECLAFYTKGYTLKQIAKFLNISPRTVEVYMKSLRDKTGTYCKNGLINYYHKHFPIAHAT